MSSFQSLTCADCPACARAVTHFSVLPDDAYMSLDDVRVRPRTQEIILWPCSDRVRSYTINLGTGTVDWNTL